MFAVAAMRTPAISVGCTLERDLFMRFKNEHDQIE
jgi:hypothetical protein